MDVDSNGLYVENPYDAAEKFLLKHDLHESFREQVADFIIKNTNGVNLGSGQYEDPFTGGNRYTPNSNQSSGSAAYSDPFTGQGSYRPKQSTTPSSTGYSDPFTGAGSYKQGSTTSGLFPVVSFD